MRDAQHKVVYRMHAIDAETLERDPNWPIEVSDDSEFDVGYVYLTIGPHCLVVDAEELAYALRAVAKWSDRGE